MPCERRGVCPKPVGNGELGDRGEFRPVVGLEDGREERHLDPEETIAQVEVGRFLDVAERAREAGDEPEQGGDAPDAVCREQAVEDARLRAGAQSAQVPAAQEDGAEPDAERQHVQRRQDRRDDHAATLAWQRSHGNLVIPSFTAWRPRRTINSRNMRASATPV